MDVIGLLTSKNVTTEHDNKVEVWFRDEENNDILVELWGRSFRELVSSMVEWENVLQVDNALAIRKESGAVSVTAEF